MQVPQGPLPVQQRPDLLSHSPCYWAATLGHKAAELGEKGRSWWLGGEGAGPAVFSCSAGFFGFPEVGVNCDIRAQVV